MASNTTSSVHNNIGTTPHQYPLLHQSSKNRDNDVILISVTGDPLEGILGASSADRQSRVVVELGQESIRAHSLNRLNSMTKELSGNVIFKCSSYPGLDRYLSASARTISTVNLETGSMTPRISTATLSQDLDAEGMTLLGLSTTSVTPLTRSTSAKCLNAIKPILIYENRKSAGDLRMRRSTSCPAIGCEHPVMRAAVPQRRGRVINNYLLPDRDVDLTGEEVGDLPIDPRMTFPDFDPDAVEDSTLTKHLANHLTFCSASLSSSLPASTFLDRHFEFHENINRPASMIQSKMASAVQAGFGISKTPPVYMTEGETVTCGSSPRRPCDFDKNYVNIGDIPSSVAERVISDCRHCRQSSPHLVEIKCLQWLNSIGNNR